MFKNLKNLKPVIGLAAASTIIMLIVNMMLFSQFYFGEHSSTLLLILAYASAFILSVLLYNKYIARQIGDLQFGTLKYVLIPIALELVLSFLMAKNEHQQRTAIEKQHSAQVAVERHLVKVEAGIKHYNELIKSAQDIDKIVNAECRRAKADTKNRAKERLFAWVSGLEFASTENVATLADVAAPKNLGCAKSGVTDKVRKINELRGMLINLAEEQSKLEGEVQILSRNSGLTYNNFGFVDFIKSNGWQLILVFIFNFVMNKLFLVPSLSRLVLIAANNDPILPRNEMLAKLVSYEFVYHEHNSKWFFLRRHWTYKRSRVVKFNCQLEEDIEKINYLHSKSCPIQAKLLTESKCESLFNIRILDDDIYDNDYRFYCFRARDFDNYFAYKVCM